MSFQDKWATDRAELEKKGIKVTKAVKKVKKRGRPKKK